MNDQLTPAEQLEVDRALDRVHVQGTGTAFGLLFGLTLFVATNILVLRDGDEVGAHLGLLSVYFPGFRVTFLGSLIGFVYAFVLGYATGRTVAALYNRLARTLR